MVQVSNGAFTTSSTRDESHKLYLGVVDPPGDPWDHNCCRSGEQNSVRTSPNKTQLRVWSSILPSLNENLSTWRV